MINTTSRFLINSRRNLLNLRLNKFASLINISSKAFAAKKKDGAGQSDKEVDKSKKTVKSAAAPEAEKKAAAPEAEKKAAGPEAEKKAAAAPKQESASEAPKEARAGNVRVIESIPGDKSPITEDTISGRYAQTLFIVASKEKNLYNVYEDMKYVGEIYEKMEAFRIFADNSGLNSAQISNFVNELAACGGFCNTTIKFCELLGKNKRFMYINEIAKKYCRSYLLLTKEEKISIISAQELTAQEKADVKTALESNPDNEGKIFIIDYSVNPNILGGLQMYTENKFMDLSLSSRLDKIKEEVNKMI